MSGPGAGVMPNTQPPMLTNHDFDKIQTFPDAKEMLRNAITLEDIKRLNEAVDERFLRDHQQLSMLDEDWEQWTQLIAQKVADIEGKEPLAPASERENWNGR